MHIVAHFGELFLGVSKQVVVLLVLVLGLSEVILSDFCLVQGKV